MDYALPHLVLFFRMCTQHSEGLLARCRELALAPGVSAADAARIGTAIARMVLDVSELMARMMVIIEVVADRAKPAPRPDERPNPSLCVICDRAFEDEPSFFRGKHGRGICERCAMMACARLGIDPNAPSGEPKKG